MTRRTEEMEKFSFLTSEGAELLSLKEWGLTEKHFKYPAMHKCG